MRDELELEPVGHGHPEVAPDGAVIGQVEMRGIDYIPESERHSNPSNLFWVLIGAQMYFGIIVIGSLPIAFGFRLVERGDGDRRRPRRSGCLLYTPPALARSADRDQRRGQVPARTSGLVGRLIGSSPGPVHRHRLRSADAVELGGERDRLRLAKLIGTPDNDANAHPRLRDPRRHGRHDRRSVGHATVLAAQKFLVPNHRPDPGHRVLRQARRLRLRLQGRQVPARAASGPPGCCRRRWRCRCRYSYSPLFANDYARYVSRKRTRTPR